MPTKNDLAQAKRSMWLLLAAGEEAESVVVETSGPAGATAFGVMLELVEALKEHAELQGCSCGSAAWLKERSRRR